MNVAQKQLVEKTLGGIGYTLLAFLLLISIASLADNPSRFVKDIFDADQLAWLVWPLVAVIALSLWARAFLRAGRTSD